MIKQKEYHSALLIGFYTTRFMSNAFFHFLPLVLLTSLLFASASQQADENPTFNISDTHYSAYVALDLLDEHDSEEQAVFSAAPHLAYCFSANSPAYPALKFCLNGSYHSIRAPPAAT